MSSDRENLADMVGGDCEMKARGGAKRRMAKPSPKRSPRRAPKRSPKRAPKRAPRRSPKKH